MAVFFLEQLCERLEVFLELLCERKDFRTVGEEDVVPHPRIGVGYSCKVSQSSCGEAAEGFGLEVALCTDAIDASDHCICDDVGEVGGEGEDFVVGLWRHDLHEGAAPLPQQAEFRQSSMIVFWRWREDGPSILEELGESCVRAAFFGSCDWVSGYEVHVCGQVVSERLEDLCFDRPHVADDGSWHQGGRDGLRELCVGSQRNAEDHQVGIFDGFAGGLMYLVCDLESAYLICGALASCKDGDVPDDFFAHQDSGEGRAYESSSEQSGFSEQWRIVFLHCLLGRGRRLRRGGRHPEQPQQERSVSGSGQFPTHVEWGGADLETDATASKIVCSASCQRAMTLCSEGSPRTGLSSTGSSFTGFPDRCAKSFEGIGVFRRRIQSLRSCVCSSGAAPYAMSAAFGFCPSRKGSVAAIRRSASGSRHHHGGFGFLHSVAGQGRTPTFCTHTCCKIA